VMGSGFQNIYPPENRKLAEEIAQNGAVISEFPIEAEPLKQNFPRRNRVISGLSLGILVVEAARNSGALITADFALEQGREVFALPGKVDCGNSFGTNALIQQGAKLVSTASDIVEEFNLFNIKKVSDIPIPTPHRCLSGSEVRASRLKKDLNAEELFLYKLISEQPATLDEIVEKANINIPDISGLLLKLEMSKLIRQLPGKQFIRTRV